MNKLTIYNSLNKSFHKKYIFNFGSEGGFYSEFNIMVFAIIYCLKYHYQFILFTGISQFTIDKGWKDFFEPFADTVNSSFYRRFNRRLTAKKIKIRHYPQWYTFKFLNKETYLSHQLFHFYTIGKFYQEQFDFPELGIKGNLKEVSREIVKMIYRFNAVTETEIKKNMSNLKLPAKYAAMHVRKGDKDTEFEFMPNVTYINKLEELSDLKHVFVFTDDYTVIEFLQKGYPHIHFYTLVNPNERGYIHSDFTKLNRSKKRADLIKLFTSIEIMAAAEITIGAYTTNPGIFLSMRMPEDSFVSIQGSFWL
ncbi:hypothetical protein [Mucilaginibacter paludis]|uniref:Glycosyl transferase family 11 n=1 Tax=Mucilaginibacter paludis DSM 18603 TaxID=714943 RepID=H1Y2S5_9SPHI|nr:hypothetical protein [Mucilaginibacter paludis]EHQ28254.1 hypothetical protein Mucpa_4163 [Mucilaginibacter paludis DSM 18603]